MTSVCRVCLAGNTSLHSLKNNKLQSLYEKLTNAKFNSEDARPRALCSFCYQKLLRCHTFSEMALRADKFFSHLYDMDLEANHEYTTEVNLNMKQHLSVVTLLCVTIDGKATNAGSQVTIKDEPLPSIVVKEEVTTEPDKLLEVESIPVNGFKSEINLEEDISDRENDAEEHLSTDDSSFTIKDESLACTDMTVEVTSEPYKMLEVVSPANCSESQITFEEDTSVPEKDVEKCLHKIHTELTKPDIKKEPFSCNNCNAIFFTKSKLISHLKNSHLKPKHNKYSYTKKHTEATNMIKTFHNQKQKVACDVCDKRFNKKSILVTHMRIHTGEKPFACHSCDKRFSNRSNLNSHMRTHTSEKPFACHDCDKRFRQSGTLNIHIKRAHTGEKPFACHSCDKRFIERSSLNKHMRTHTGEKPFACHGCDKRFTQSGSLNIHIMRTHTGEMPFACHGCDKIFSKRSTLNNHMRTHTGEKPFACQSCDKRFAQSGSLNIHIMRTHTGEKPFACHGCGKRFIERSTLNKHMRTHTGEKPFACHGCDKRFSERSSLNKHMRAHTGEKPFVCHGCDKRFNERSYLNKHIMRTHSGEKPFACNGCDKRFTERSTLNKHMRTHTGEKPFVCHGCDKRFNERGNLNRHIMKTHTGESHLSVMNVRNNLVTNVI